MMRIKSSLSACSSGMTSYAFLLMSEASYSVLSTQNTKCFPVVMGLFQIPLDFQVFPTNSVCFVPVKFDMADSAIGQSHKGNTFQLSPVTATVDSLQISQISNTWADCNRLNGLNVANDFKFHGGSLAFLEEQDKSEKCRLFQYAVWNSDLFSRFPEKQAHSGASVFTGWRGAVHDDPAAGHKAAPAPALAGPGRPEVCGSSPERGGGGG